FLLFQAEDGIRGFHVTGVQTCALPILSISNTQARPSTINLTRVPKACPSHSKGLVFTYIGKLPVRWDRYHSRDRDKARSSSAGRSEERRVGKEGRYCGLETSVETNGKL